jgi:Zn-dependent protease
MNCDKCQKEVFLPFRCQFCGGYFCSDHRLPENHECPQIELARLPRNEQPQMATPRQGGYEYTVSYGPVQTAKARIRFSGKEISHLSVATVLVIGVGLSIFGIQTRFIGDYLTLVLAVAVFTCSFLIHEMAHKVAAQRRGLWAEFRLTVMGAILTLISTVSPIFKVISPGAVMISGHAGAEGIGKISIAGPLTNIALSTAFLALAFPIVEYPSVAFALAVGAAFNAWIALFNLIPLGILDGLKIFVWNKLVWVATFTASLALTAASTYFYGAI